MADFVDEKPNVWFVKDDPIIEPVGTHTSRPLTVDEAKAILREEVLTFMQAFTKTARRA